jgi:hypothetical protein
VTVVDDALEVKNGRGETILKGSYGATPNAHLLVALIREHLPHEDRTTVR